MRPREAAELVAGIDPETFGEALGPRARRALAAILSGSWAWSAIASLPGGERAAWELIALDVLDVWSDHPNGPHVSLSVMAANRLGVAIVEDARKVYRPDGTGVSQVIEEPGRWASTREADSKSVRIPRARGFAPLPFPELVPAPGPAIDEDEFEEAAELPSAPLAQRVPELRILGVLAKKLAPKPRSAKKSKKRRRA